MIRVSRPMFHDRRADALVARAPLSFLLFFSGAHFGGAHDSKRVSLNVSVCPLSTLQRCLPQHLPQRFHKPIGVP